MFGKIYAAGHVRVGPLVPDRADLLYGRLEDETPFGSVRRLADVRGLRAEVPARRRRAVARPYGIVELTPNAEYMIVMEFFEGAKNLGDSDIDDTVIDEGVRPGADVLGRGVAHRDVKPANLLVRDGHLQLVDVSALEIRPSPWRQAVDLANMLLTLASAPTRIAYTGGPTRRVHAGGDRRGDGGVPGTDDPERLAAKMKADGRPLLERFRECGAVPRRTV